MKTCNFCKKEVLTGKVICGDCDVVAVVRCGDCKHSYHTLSLTRVCKVVLEIRGDKEFCSLGERNDSNEY